ncbi:MAG: shikimate kinase [Coriobacteriia bacterium]|nr:shikimate kinase [Coriobacteriia bacterium]
MRRGHIFLVGFMGSGKSTVASVVADRLGIPCVDIDQRIEAQQGASIAEVFTVSGEAAFRALETEALLALEGVEPSVVACGGGVVLSPENRAALKRMGIVVLLEVSAAEAIARIGDVTTRPLLAGGSGTLAATTLLQAREGLYRSVADVSIQTGGHTPDEVATALLAKVEDVS